MPTEVEIINPTEFDGWDDLVASSPQSSFFHTAAWAKVLAETYNYRPLYFTLREGNKLLALVPVMEVKSIFTGLRGVSLPFTDYCQALADDQSQLSYVLDFAKEYGRKCRWKFIEMRGGNFSDTAVMSFFYKHTLKLEADSEKMFSRLDDTVKRNIRKAQRQGVEITVNRSLDTLKEFCRMHYMTRKKHGIPPQPWSFFKKIYEHIISKNLGFVMLASHGKINIAGAVYFNFKDKWLYKFGASDFKFQHLRANNLLMWEAIKFSAGQGGQNFCFGRTEPDNAGLRRFKCGWGSEEQIINYYKYDLRRDAFVSASPVVNNSHHYIFRGMPVPLLKICGSLLYKHMG